MKKQLFFGSALLAAIGAFAQTPSGKINGGIADVVRNKYVINENLKSVQENPPVHTANAKRSSGTAVDAQWKLISQSMNFFGVLVPDSKPLYYNAELDAVSFVQRVSPNYTPNPVPSADARSGVMVAMVSSDWGSHWDSTCIFNNDLYLTRYPQGGIFNPPGNTQGISGAYVVGMGPGTTPTPQKWIGNWFASKKLNVFNNVADVSDPLSQQFITSYPVDTVVGKVDFARQDFVITSDGYVRALGGIFDDINATTVSGQGFRGGRIVKGQFSSGHFVWTGDSISLHDTPTAYDSTTNTFYNQFGIVNMAWGESGQYGYLWFLGLRTGATGNNLGFTPIIWKTSDHGTSWHLMPAMNFNDTVTFQPVLSKLDAPEVPANWGARRLPFFNYGEEIAGVVDGNNKLHIVSTMWSVRDTTTGALWTYTNTAGDGQVYRYKHTASSTDAPIYIYDFTETNTGWNVVVVDSMASEYPSTTSGSSIYNIGYSENPWAVYTGSKQSSNARIQLSRTSDGKFIVYTWAESNTQITNGGLRWNNKPDIHVRMRDINDSKVLNGEFDVTGSAEELFVQAAAFLHNTSPTCKVTSSPTAYTLKLPLKISNSATLEQDKTCNHYYSTAELAFPRSDVGFKENELLGAGSALYPNPAANSAVLQLQLKNNSKVSVKVMNSVGQILSTTNTDAVAGANEININMEGLSSGIYLVNVNIDGASITKKLIVK